jgi:hypothetical protein
VVVELTVTSGDIRLPPNKPLKLTAAGFRQSCCFSPTLLW